MESHLSAAHLLVLFLGAQRRLLRVARGGRKNNRYKAVPRVNSAAYAFICANSLLIVSTKCDNGEPVSPSFSGLLSQCTYARDFVRHQNKTKTNHTARIRAIVRLSLTVYNFSSSFYSLFYPYITSNFFLSLQIEYIFSPSI